GKQDQYAATFGGVNFMEFFKEDKVIVNPLRIRTKYLNELAHNLVLYYTGTSRLSSVIIESQSKNVQSKNQKTIQAMNKLKEQAVLMKEAILKGELEKIGEILDYSWVYKTAKAHGASGGKISGAGGGGFIFFYCPGNTRHEVIKAVESFGGKIKRYEFTKKGLTTWGL
ncbi:MAG: dehydrogenase, partial [Bacteroidetes bacterium 4572_114]